MTLGSRSAQAELFRSPAQVGNGHGIEARFDPRGEITKHRFGHATRIGGRGALGARLAIAEHDRPFERPHDVAQANVRRPAGEAVATLRAALAADDAGALELL